MDSYKGHPLEEYKKSHNSSEMMQVDSDLRSQIYSNNVQDSNQDEIDDVECRYLLDDLCKADPKEVFKSELKDDEKVLSEKSQQNQEEMISDTMKIEDRYDDYNFDFFDIMKNVLCDDGCIEDLDSQDKEYY